VSYGKSSGTPDSYRDGFACPFLCLFLLGKQKKEEKAFVTRQRHKEYEKVIVVRQSNPE